MMRFPDWVVQAGHRERTDYGEFVTAPDSIYSCLLPWALRETSSVFREECRALGRNVLGRGARIVDATANIGCDAVNFCRMFPGAQVTAVEINAATAVQLRQNASPDGPARYFRRGRLLETLERHAAGELPPIEVVQADCVEYLSNCGRVDLVYFDPPWCEQLDVGAAHGAALDAAHGAALDAALDAALGAAALARPQRRATLELGGRPLSAIAGETLRNNAPLIVVKVPPEYGSAQLSEEISSAFGGPVIVRAYDIHKPRGDTAYRLMFVRAA